MNSVKREVFNFSQFLQTEKNITNAIQISPTARENGPGKEQCTWGSKGASGSEPGFVRNSAPRGPSLEVQRLGLWAFTTKVWVQPLVGELRYHKPHDVAKNGGKKKRYRLLIN